MSIHYDEKDVCIEDLDRTIHGLRLIMENWKTSRYECLSGFDMIEFISCVSKAEQQVLIMREYLSLRKRRELERAEVF